MPVLETMMRTPARRRERRRGGLILLVVLILLVCLVGAAGGWWAWASAASGPQEKIVVVVPQGSSGSDVARILEQEHVVRSSFAFKVMARFRGFAQGFQAGTYTNLTTNMSAAGALAALKKGPLPQKTLTAVFPEGLTITQTAAAVQDQLGIPTQEFLSAARSGTYSLTPYLPKGTPSLEGFLFPKKYDFLAGVTADDVIKKMLGQLSKEVRGLPWDDYRAFRLGSKYQVLVVASMIEREARFPDDRPKIAAVIYNRLKKGMLLQIDATVEYALGSYKSKLTYDDLKVNSPYNTYLHTGLPPTPIANPGLASIEAALSPASGNWLYYIVCDQEGHHAFTSSYSTFLRLKANPSC
jgi:peptidoglycan lytic transglycosylase G